MKRMKKEEERVILMVESKSSDPINQRYFIFLIYPTPCFNFHFLFIQMYVTHEHLHIIILWKKHESSSYQLNLVINMGST
jgi:hypothetical protein